MAIIPYTVLPSKSQGKVYLPLARIVLNYKKTHKITPKPILALIDSGAGVCFCHDLIGVWLGVRLDKIKIEKEFTAANMSTFKTKSEIITLHAFGKSYDCKFYFTDVLPRHTPIILGQVGFFDHFKISFDYQKTQIELI